MLRPRAMERMTSRCKSWHLPKKPFMVCRNDRDGQLGRSCEEEK